jgi:hypothetical protein
LKSIVIAALLVLAFGCAKKSEPPADQVSTTAAPRAETAVTQTGAELKEESSEAGDEVTRRQGEISQAEAAKKMATAAKDINAAMGGSTEAAQKAGEALKRPTTTDTATTRH